VGGELLAVVTKGGGQGDSASICGEVTSMVNSPPIKNTPPSNTMKECVGVWCKIELLTPSLPRLLISGMYEETQIES